MTSTLLIKIFGGVASAVVKKVVESAFGCDGDELSNRVQDAMDCAAAGFFGQFGQRYGVEHQSFLARQENWVTVASSLRYDTPNLAVDQLNARGYDDAPDADELALRTFVDLVAEEFKKDLFLGLMLGVKESVILTRESEQRLMAVLGKLVTQLGSELKSPPKPGMKLNVEGGDLPRQTSLEDGKLYVRKITEIAGMTYMRRGHKIYCEASLEDGAVMYLEIDEKADILVRRPPYPLSLHIPPEYVLGHEDVMGSDGHRKIVMHGKWGLQIECTVTPDGKYANPNILNGQIMLNVRDKKMIVVPKDMPCLPESRNDV